MSEEPKLPNVSNLKPDVRSKVMALMDELAEVVQKRVQITEREDKLKEELDKIREEGGLPGFRYGSLIFEFQRVSGRRTLDKMLLLENGCPIAVLNASYKEGKASQRLIFRDLEHDA